MNLATCSLTIGVGVYIGHESPCFFRGVLEWDKPLTKRERDSFD